MSLPVAHDYYHCRATGQQNHVHVSIWSEKKKVAHARDALCVFRFFGSKLDRSTRIYCRYYYYAVKVQKNGESYHRREAKRDDGMTTSLCLPSSYKIVRVNGLWHIE